MKRPRPPHFDVQNDAYNASNKLVCRRIQQKQYNIDRLSQIVATLEVNRLNRGYTLLLCEPKDMMIERTLSVPLFQNTDVLHHIMSLLFRVPLYFNIDTPIMYRPSYENSRSMKSICNLVQTCHYMSDIIGVDIRKYRPTLSIDCLFCEKKHIKCKECHTFYCYSCNIDKYPIHECTSCKSLNRQCACRRAFKDSDMSIRCFNCHKSIKNSQFI